MEWLSLSCFGSLNYRWTNERNSKVSFENEKYSIPEPVISENSLEQIQTFLESVDQDVLLQHLVVLADGGQEHDHQHVLKTVNPLLPLRSLSSNINHDELSVFFVLESVLNYSRGFDSHLEDILGLR